MRMNKFWLVFRTQFFAAVSAGKAKRRSRVDKAATFSGYALGWLVITALASFYEFIYGVALINSGFPNAFPTLIIFAASILTLLTSISYTKSLIFCSKDHDMLFALPIRGSVIVAAKIATLYVLDLAVTLAILLPCGVIYGYFVQPSWLFYVLYYTVVLFVPMLPILIAAFVSALVSLIASRFRRAKIVGTVLYIAIFFAFMLGIMNISQSSEEELSQIITGMTEAIYSFYPPLAWASDGISGNPLMYLLFIGVSLAAFAVIVLVFGRFYGKIHGLFSARSFRSKYKISAASGSAKSACQKRACKVFLVSRADAEPIIRLADDGHLYDHLYGKRQTWRGNADRTANSQTVCCDVSVSFFPVCFHCVSYQCIHLFGGENIRTFEKPAGFCQNRTVGKASRA